MAPMYRVAAVYAALLACIPGAASALTCAELDGAYVISQENPPVYLGFFGSPSAVDSIENPFGAYGNPSSVGSVRNTSGPYGSSSGQYSANNPSTSTPPLFGKFDVATGYLSNNTFLSGSVSLASIDASCGTTNFVSTQPAANPASRCRHAFCFALPTRFHKQALQLFNRGRILCFPWRGDPKGTPAGGSRRDHDVPTKEAPPWILAPATLNQASPAGARSREGIFPPPPSTK